MASKAPPPSSPPAGIPSGGGAKYVVVAILLLGLVGGAIVWKLSQSPPARTVIVLDAAPPPAFSGRNLDEDIPPPEVLPDASAEDDAGKKAVVAQPASNPCDVKTCNGTSTEELSSALQFRVTQARRCYNNALSQDPTLQGKLTVAVRIASNGQVCSASIASNEMGSAQVGTCVADSFRRANFPAPKGGCVDANIPINFVAR